jgi:hypothetical protein
MTTQASPLRQNRDIFRGDFSDAERYIWEFSSGMCNTKVYFRLSVKETNVFSSAKKILVI